MIPHGTRGGGNFSGNRSNFVLFTNFIVHLGFGFTEVGSVTPKPQPGNPQPRVFRLTADKAVINRYGFNSDGLDVVKERLETYRRNRADPQSLNPIRRFLISIGWSPEMCKDGLVGVNVGCNKENVTDPAADYTRGILELAPLADYVVINISSPNTPGLRALQKKEMLENLVKRSLEAHKAVAVSRRIPLLVKISPDLTQDEMKDIADIALKHKVDGLIISNTTISRPLGLQSPASLVDQAGGLSGVPLKHQATRVLRGMYELTGGKIPLIGSGGITTAEDAYERIRAGASLVQLYTGLTYEGPSIAHDINRDLAKLLNKDGFTKISQAIGADHRLAQSQNSKNQK